MNILIIIILVTDIKCAQLLCGLSTHISLYDTPLLWCLARRLLVNNNGPHYYVTGYHDVDMGARESFPITLMRALFSSFILWFSFFTSCKLCAEEKQYLVRKVRGQLVQFYLVPSMQLAVTTQVLTHF